MRLTGRLMLRRSCGNWMNWKRYLPRKTVSDHGFFFLGGVFLFYYVKPANPLTDTLLSGYNIMIYYDIMGA